MDGPSDPTKKASETRDSNVTSAPDAETPGAAPPAHDSYPPPFEAEKSGRLDQFIPEVIKRTLYAGLGAVFTTEEGIRKIASDFHLPKDVANFLIQQAATSKDELFRIVAKELRAFLENVNLSGELQKVLTSLSFEIKTEVRFIPNDEAVGGLKPEIKRKMAMKRDKDGS